ncbi:MAG: efflux RND transporter periplasmic adaptor subunit [Sideroxydans sp.]|nr:efflux RND transporter periplasmic adaptor subunit [Sideroxydans sp.]
MKKYIVTGLVVIGLVGAGYAVWFATAPKTGGMAASADKRGAKPTPVHLVTVTSSAVPIVLDAVGNAEAEQSVAVRAEVSGVLKKIHFREGDAVKAGQLLFQIEASVSQAEVDKARANLARDQAAAREARTQAHRLQPLAELEYVTQQEYAQAVAQQQAAEATVRADQAALKSVQAQLGYARITAPITGRAGILNIKQGNLVSAASATPLVTINATRPLLVAFSVPQQQLQAIREQQRTHKLEVEVRRDAGQALLGKGALAFIDNAVDMQTGTIRMKALIPNKDEAIWPGELVSLRLILGVQQNALVVPETAIQLGQNGSYVYALVDGKAHMQPVKVARQLGSQVVIAEGLQAGQQVIVNPPSNLRPEGAVEVIAAKAANKGNKP